MEEKRIGVLVVPPANLAAVLRAAGKLSSVKERVLGREESAGVALWLEDGALVAVSTDGAGLLEIRCKLDTEDARASAGGELHLDPETVAPLVRVCDAAKKRWRSAPVRLDARGLWTPDGDAQLAVVATIATPFVPHWRNVLTSDKDAIERSIVRWHPKHLGRIVDAANALGIEALDTILCGPGRPSRLESVGSERVRLRAWLMPGNPDVRGREPIYAPGREPVAKAVA